MWKAKGVGHRVVVKVGWVSMPRDCLEEADWLWVPRQEPQLSALPTLPLRPIPLSLVLREAERTQAGRGGDRLDHSQPEAQAHSGPGVCGPEPAGGGATDQVERGECVGLVWRGLGAGRQGGRITAPLPRGGGAASKPTIRVIKAALSIRLPQLPESQAPHTSSTALLDGC